MIRHGQYKQPIYASLPPLAENILYFIQNKNQVIISDIIHATQAPRSTIKKYLNLLINQKYLTRHGKSRGTWYTVNKKT